MIRATTTSSMAAENDEYVRVVFVGAGPPGTGNHVTENVVWSPKKRSSIRVTADVKLLAPDRASTAD